MRRPATARRRPDPRHRLGLVLGLLAVLAAGPVSADGSRLYVLDPARSHIRFHAVSRLMSADGRFGRLAGEIRLDESRPDTASGRLTVDVASIDTGIRMRDNHLRGDDFFHVELHPEATFVTSSVRREADRWVVAGQLTIRGVTRPVTVPVTVTGSEGTIRIVGELSVSRREFGVAYQSVLNPIRDEVRVWFELTGTPK